MHQFLSYVFSNTHTDGRKQYPTAELWVMNSSKTTEIIFFLNSGLLVLHHCRKGVRDTQLTSWAAIQTPISCRGRSLMPVLHHVHVLVIVQPAAPRLLTGLHPVIPTLIISIHAVVWAHWATFGKK